jgi:hypothetical protein
MEEREQERRQARLGSSSVDPEKVRQAESLRLARTEMERQLEATAHEARRKQLGQAIAEIDKRLKALAK